MDTAFVVMTAMPPTTGHLQLIQFASNISDNGRVVVIVCSPPNEPYPVQRFLAIHEAVKRCLLDNVTVMHFNMATEQDPNAVDFQEMWTNIYKIYGCGVGDYIVASETYGKWLAEKTGATFYPYDIDRSLNHIKATDVRETLLDYFNNIIPEFQSYLKTTVTIFGAESTGKTTLSQQLGEYFNTPWLFEYARPYLETIGSDITVDSMTAIWKGQKALQIQGDNLNGGPLIIQDTDLYSTVGYWSFSHWQEKLGDVPKGLIQDAASYRSDLYIITQCNIPFEPDPLRYGGDKREGDDQYWIDICDRYGLKYIVLESTDQVKRLIEARDIIDDLMDSKTESLKYDRHGF